MNNLSEIVTKHPEVQSAFDAVEEARAYCSHGLAARYTAQYEAWKRTVLDLPVGQEAPLRPSDMPPAEAVEAARRQLRLREERLASVLASAFDEVAGALQEREVELLDEVRVMVDRLNEINTEIRELVSTAQWVDRTLGRQSRKPHLLLQMSPVTTLQVVTGEAKGIDGSFFGSFD